MGWFHNTHNDLFIMTSLSWPLCFCFFLNCNNYFKMNPSPITTTSPTSIGFCYCFLCVFCCWGFGGCFCFVACLFVVVLEGVGSGGFLEMFSLYDILHSSTTCLFVRDWDCFFCHLGGGEGWGDFSFPFFFFFFYKLFHSFTQFLSVNICHLMFQE